jgi:hypothetical protein
MVIPSEITVQIARLSQELNAIESEVAEGLKLIRDYLFCFPDNAQLMQLFASLNNALLFRETYNRVIAETAIELSVDDVPPDVIQETGEDLATIFGRVLEVKINVS